jgi:predicted metal-dependent phosphotriesterase family hydrolase
MRLLDQVPKRGGGFGNLGEAIRRMQEQGGMGMPANPDGRVYAGGSPGLYAPGGRFNRGNNPGMNFGDQIGYTRPNKDPSMPIAFNDPSFRMTGTPQPIARRDPSALERLPMGGAPSFNPTIFGQPIPQGADFSNMPDFSQIDMSQLDLSGIPQSISQMNLPQMPEGLPSMEEIQGNRRMPQMRMGEMQPRMMMAEGDEVINIIDVLQEYGLTVPREVAEQLSRKSGLSLQSINEIINEGGRTISDMDRQQTGRTISDLGRGRTISDLDRGRTISDMDRQQTGRTISDLGRGRTISDMDRQIGMTYGGEMKGYANGGEIENMLSGMDSGEQEAMGELEQMAPEMEMIDQLVMMVAQMIQQGAGEEQVISFLREQGLDDEDIGTVLQLVAEMAETEEVAAQNEIGADLEQLG